MRIGLVIVGIISINIAFIQEFGYMLIAGRLVLDKNSLHCPVSTSLATSVSTSLMGGAVVIILLLKNFRCGTLQGVASG